jgi:hypothetical protein
LHMQSITQELRRGSAMTGVGHGRLRQQEQKGDR